MPSLTLNYTNAEATRIAAAYGRKLNLGRDANGAEVKQQLNQHLINDVQEQEAAVALATAAASVTPIAPT